MLERLRIKNFKAWGDTGDIELAPITIFFGTNSSGKTSLQQLLLLLQQTAQSSDRRRVLHLGDQNSTIDLGTFSNIIHNHGERERLEFELAARGGTQRGASRRDFRRGVGAETKLYRAYYEFRRHRPRRKDQARRRVGFHHGLLAWTTQTPVTVKDSRSDLRLSSSELRFRAAIEQSAAGRLRVAEMNYRLGKGGPRDKAVSAIELGMRVKGDDDKQQYALTKSGYVPIRNQGRKWPLPPPTRFYGFPDEAIAYYQNTEFLADFNLQLEHLLSSIHYVGPLREHPKRLYLWSGEEPEHVGARGERAIEALLAGGQRRMNRRHKERL